MTTPEVSPWRALFKQVERVYVETASLLREADGLLDQAGFTLREGENSMGWQLSGQPTRPAWWFPGWVGRLYVPRSATETSRLLYVTVYLYQRAGDDLGPLDEAAVAGGVWRFEDGAVRTDPWLAKGWAWRRKEEPYGVVMARADEPEVRAGAGALRGGAAVDGDRPGDARRARDHAAGCDREGRDMVSGATRGWVMRELLHRESGW